jgi:hypothetical protein
MPVSNFAIANKELAKKPMEKYYSCCGKSICRGRVHSLCGSGNDNKCLFCNSNGSSKTDEERVGEVIRRVEANDAGDVYAGS